MITNEIKNSIKGAVSDLKTAENELCRPSEDIMALSLCLTARKSMNTLLGMYLLSNSAAYNKEGSLDDLLNHCKSIDSQFASLNLSKIYCSDLEIRECDKKYCLSNHTVADCITVANQLKSLVLNKLKLNEADLH